MPFQFDELNLHPNLFPSHHILVEVVIPFSFKGDSTQMLHSLNSRFGKG